jgi:hypothetical protein
MDKKFTPVCGNKYGISANNTIVLPVSLENLPNEIMIYGNKLVLKPSFHISLVCINKIIEKYNVSDPGFRDSVLKDFCEFVGKNDVSLLNFNEEFKFAEENELKTVVVLCKVSNLDKFFENINKKYGLNVEYPPTHVTLYSIDGKGIFLTDSSDIKNLTKPIPNPTGRKL